MKNLGFIGLTLFIAISAFASNPSNSKGNVITDCAFASVKDEYKRSKAVFAGKVVKTLETADSRTFEFKIEKYWKGVKSKKVKITVSKTMRFEPFYQQGNSYLIYAFADEKGVLRTAKCSRGFQIEFAKDDLKILGKGKIPR